MADITFPTATVVWRAAALEQDSDDTGDTPEERLLGGLRVRLIPSPKVVDVASPPEGLPPTTYHIKEWDLLTTNDGSLINAKDPTKPVKIIASDAFPGYTIEWTSIIEDPSLDLPPMTKVWLAPAGSTISLTTVVHMPPNPMQLADYLQAVVDARSARDIAVSAKNDSVSAKNDAVAAKTAAEKARDETEQVYVLLGNVSGTKTLTLAETNKPTGWDATLTANTDFVLPSLGNRVLTCSLFLVAGVAGVTYRILGGQLSYSQTLVHSGEVNGKDLVHLLHYGPRGWIVLSGAAALGVPAEWVS